MKLLYFSRHLNRSGYYILEHLIRTNKKSIAGIILPQEFHALNNPLVDKLALFSYKLETIWYRCPSIRFTKSLVKLGEKYSIPIFFVKSAKTKSFYELLSSLNPDLIVLGGGWPELIPERIISYPKYGSINTHPSLLPAFRGTDIHRWQILNNVKKSGATIHIMDDKFDTGPILAQTTVDISANDTPQSLFEKTARSAAPLMSDVIDHIKKEGQTYLKRAKKQNLVRKKYFSAWDWNDNDLMRINWNKSAQEIYQLVLASQQESYKYKGPCFNLKKNKFYLRKAGIISGLAKPGEIVFNKNKAAIGCETKGKLIEIIQIQKAGTKINIYRADLGFRELKKLGIRGGEFAE